jgi:hypothetical protein
MLNHNHITSSTLLGLAALAMLTGCSGLSPVHSDVLTQTPAPQPAETDTPIPTPQLVENVMPTPVLSPAVTPWPTPTPDAPTPTQTPYVTSTPIPASQMRGEWRRITTADGLCTDWPLFIGSWYIGTGTTTVCYTTSSSGNEITWLTTTVPLGTRVTAVDKFPTDGSALYATDAGACWHGGHECQAPDERYPYKDIRRIDQIVVDPVLMLSKAVVYKEQVYSVPEIVGAEDAYPTWIAVSGVTYGGVVPEIWVGTNGYGVVVIQPGTESLTRYATADGLPGNLVRDISTEKCPKYCDFRDIWVATDNGVGHWDGQQWTAYTTADGLPSNDVRGVASNQRNTVWIATAGGVAYFDGQSWQAFTHENGLPEGDLNGVLFRGDEIWFSTRGSGLLVFVIQTPTQDRVVQGYGDFPRLPVVAPAADGTTLALYLVKGETATQLATLEGTRTGSNRADAYLSPDGQYVVYLRTEGEYMRRVLEVADTQEDRRMVIAEGAKGVHQRGAGSETLTSVAWMDAEHILYSKVRWPSSEEREASWEAETPLPVEGEVWMSSVDGKEQRLLASGRIYQVLGASSEGKALYVTRLMPGHEMNREEGFALVDTESGEMTDLWPEEEQGVKRYLNFKLVVLPDGSRRLLFVTRDWGDSAATQPPVIWVGDPESGQDKVIWTIDQGKDWSKGEKRGTIYDTPRNFLWSPRSEYELIYLAGDVLGGVWHVDLETGKAEPLGQVESLGKTGLRLLAWASEGIVIQSQDVIWLLDEWGEVQGEIHFREE